MRARVNVKCKVSGAEVSGAIVGYVNDCGGIVQALKDFKPDSNSVAWGRNMSKLGYSSTHYGLTALEGIRDYVVANNLPIGQVLTYLYHRGDIPVREAIATHTQEDTAMVQIDSSRLIKSIESKLRDIGDLLRQLKAL